MTDHRHPGVRDRPHRVRHRPAALQFHGIHAAVLQQTTGVAHRLGPVSLVGHERHIADEIRVLRPAPHGLAVVQHLVHRHRHGGIIAQHHHAQRITDQDRVQSRPIRSQRAGIVVGGDHGDWLAPRLLLLKRQDGYLLTRHVGLRLRCNKNAPWRTAGRDTMSCGTRGFAFSTTYRSTSSAVSVAIAIQATRGHLVYWLIACDRSMAGKA